MNDRSHLPPDATRSIEELDRLLADPARWAEIDPDKLRHLLFYRCLAYGLQPDEDEIPLLMDLHRVAVARLQPAVRRQVVVHLARAIERVHREHGFSEGAGCTNALLPFLLEDPDPAVVSAAATEMAVLLPAENGDPLTGPRYVRSLVEEVRGEEARAGIVGGLLQLGDPVLAPLLTGAWRVLGDEGRQSLALLVQAFRGVHTLAVEFLLEWLEDEATDPRSASFGVVAATLARAGRYAAENGVSQVRWTFPATDAPESEPSEVREMSLDEFAPSLEQRLLRVAEREQPPELMPHVLSYWGFERAGYRLAARAAAASAEAAGGQAGVCEPVRLDLVPDWPEEPEEETLLEWGTFNPLGPSINTIRLTPLGASSALVHTLYHPAGSSSRLMALLPQDRAPELVGSVLTRIMAANGTGGAWLLRGLPDYVYLPDGPGVIARAQLLAAIAAARRAAVAAGEETMTLSAHSERLQRLARDPWGTAREEIDRAAAAAEGQPAPAPDGPRLQGDLDDGAAYDRWLAIAGAPGHVAAIRGEMAVAWQRALEAAGGKD